MKDEKIFAGGQDLAGRGVYREKMLPFAANELILTTVPRQESSTLARSAYAHGKRVREQLRRLDIFNMRRLQSFQAHTELHLFNTGTTAARSHVDPGINY